MPSDPTAIRYEAHPSMLRMRPFATVMVLLLMLLGLLVAVLGDGLLPAALRAGAGTPEPVQTLGILVFAVSALQLLIWWVSTRSDHLRITDDEVLWTHGLISKQYTELSMGSVRTVRVTQSLLQRMMRAGDIAIFTTGDIPELVVRGLPDPRAIRELVRTRGTGQAA
jgi:uncharacterized membrane protein YdbT with pleckstrin-like domain